MSTPVPAFKLKWRAHTGRLHLLLKDDGEVVDQITGDYRTDTWKVASSEKIYATLKDAQKAAEIEFHFRLLEKAKGLTKQ